jgi:hypothetical protein
MPLVTRFSLKKLLTLPWYFEILMPHTVTTKPKNMRTKILLTAAAAMAAGVVASSAQVYSANVVGYANVVMAGASGYTLIANPFDDGNGNQLTNLVNSLPNKSEVVTWNGSGFNTAIQKVSGVWNGNVSLPPGTGFFVKNGIASSPPVTNTFVGSVIVLVGASSTNTLPSGYSLVGSVIPYAADATTDTNINLGANLANKSQLIDWNTGSQGYDTADQKISGTWQTPFNVSVGEGFFIKAQVGGSNWVETLQP